jgi:hypothetical protein
MGAARYAKLLCAAKEAAQNRRRMTFLSSFQRRLKSSGITGLTPTATLLSGIGSAQIVELLHRNVIFKITHN